MYWNPPDLRPIVFYILHLFVPLPLRIWSCKECNKNSQSATFDAKRTLDMSNLTIFYSLQNSWLALLIGLDTQTIMLSKIGVPYLWILSWFLVSINHDDVIKWEHFPRYWIFVRGIHRSTVNSPHKGQWRGALMFSLICAWMDGWVNNLEAGDLRRYCAHYDVTVMSACRLP